MKPKCPFSGVESTTPSTRPRPYYDELIGKEHLRHALNKGLITQDKNEMHFYLPHQMIELCWMNVECIIEELASAYQSGKLNTQQLLREVERIGQIFQFVNAIIGFMTKVLTPEEFVLFRDDLAPASGFQSGYHRLELLLTDEEYLLSLEPNDEGRFYWECSSVGADTLHDMAKLQGLEELSQSWQGKTLASIFCSSEEFKQNNALILAMKKVDHTFSEGFKLAHLRLANLFLSDMEKGTGESDFRTYLNKSREYHLFPFL